MAPLSTAMTLKRIHREIADIKKEDLGDITLTPLEDNLFLWNGSIPGPKGSVYEGGVFKVCVQLAPDYPFSAPKVTFATRIYHMNISEKGNICIDILKHNWSPALSLFKVMLSLSSLLTDPNPKDPLVPSIATEFVRKREQHDKTARQWTELYARPPPPLRSRVSSSPKADARSKLKGKARAATPNTSARPSTAPLATETIVVDDSDDEQPGSQRARPPGATGKKRKRESRTTGQVDVDLSLISDDEGDAGASGNKRREVARAAGSSRNGRPNARPAGSKTMGEVIVIDD